MTNICRSFMFGLALVVAPPALGQTPGEGSAAAGAGGARLLRIPGQSQQPAATTGGCASKPVRVIYTGYGEASPTPSCPQTFPNGNYSQPDGDRAPQ